MECYVFSRFFLRLCLVFFRDVTFFFTFFVRCLWVFCVALRFVLGFFAFVCALCVCCYLFCAFMFTFFLRFIDIPESQEEIGCGRHKFRPLEDPKPLSGIC